MHIFGDNKRPARGPSLSVNHRNEVVIAWTVGEDASANIHFAKSIDGGKSFSPAQTVFESEGHADAPHIAFDGKGTLHLVYGESALGPFRQYRILYTRLRNGESKFEKPKEIVGADMGKFESAHFPELDIDGNDNTYIIWKLFPRATGRPLGMGFTYSKDGGQTFIPPTIIPGTDDPALGFLGSMNGLLMQEIAVNRLGKFAIVYSTFKANDASHIWLIRGNVSHP